MFAVNHAVTALALRRLAPEAPLPWLLLAVQAMELVWLLLHALGIEHTVVAPVVESVADVRLIHMPYSHSVGGAIFVAALFAAFGAWRWSRRTGLVLAAGVLSHLLLDLATHAPDIALAPSLSGPMLGSGLYAAAPVAAFVLEVAWGLFCWSVGGRGRGLLALVLVGNVANLSLFVPALPGPEALLGGKPMLLVAVVGVQIVVTLALAGQLARGRSVPPPGVVAV